MTEENVSPITCLPTELLLLIAGNLRGDALVSFALTCKRFSNICRSSRSINFENSQRLGFSKGTPASQLTLFFKLSIDPLIVTECNFNNCYWVPASTFQNFIVKCPNLVKLYVAETNLTVEHLMIRIFPKCQKITHLSLTLSRGDFWMKRSSSSRPDEKAEVFHQSCNQVLRNLISIELIVKSAVKTMLELLGCCENLKSLVVFRSRFEGEISESIPPTASLPIPSGLESLVFTGIMEDGDCQLRLNSGEDERLSTLWSVCKMSMGTGSTTRVVKSDERKNFLALAFRHAAHPQLYVADKRQGGGGYLDAEDLDEMESCAWEPIPTFVPKGLVAPRLKLISCFYSNQGFSDFCNNHPFLRVLRLKSAEMELPTADAWNSQSWGGLRELRVLSIEPCMAADGLTTTRKRKLEESGSTSSISGSLPPLVSVLQSCPFLQELEIALFGDSIARTPVTIRGQDLSVIAQCASLKRLTLADFGISDGRFLEDILRDCKRLESLRLKDLGPTGLCCYSKNLCAALPHGRNLTTLSLFQRNLTPMSKLLDALEACPSVIQLGLVCPSGSPPFKLTSEGFGRRLLQLCQRLNRLVAFFCVLSIPKSHCSQAGRLLNRAVTAERPAFRADVQPWDPHSRFQCDFSVLPLVHKQLLVHFSSQVGILPYHLQSFLL